jgi:hypothetical protein
MSFTKSKKLKVDIIVTRREKTNYMVEHAKKGIFISEGFLSTSIIQTNTNYGKYIHDILIPKGTKVPYLEEISLKPRDMEVLLPEETKLKLIESKGKYRLWKLIN